MLFNEFAFVGGVKRKTFSEEFVALRGSGELFFFFFTRPCFEGRAFSLILFRLISVVARDAYTDLVSFHGCSENLTCTCCVSVIEIDSRFFSFK